MIAYRVLPLLFVKLFPLLSQKWEYAAPDSHVSLLPMDFGFCISNAGDNLFEFLYALQRDISYVKY